MKTTPLIACVLAGLALSGAGPTARAKEPNPPDRFRAIFKGKDLTGWYGLSPHSIAPLKEPFHGPQEIRAEHLGS